MTDCRSAALSIDEAQSLTSDYGGLLCCIILMQCAAGHGLAWDAAIPRRKLPPSSAHMLTAQNMRASFWQVILVQDRAAVPPQEGQEYRHGITPPMRNVRNRLFKPLDLPEPAVMRQLALELEQIAKVISEFTSLIVKHLSSKATLEYELRYHAFYWYFCMRALALLLVDTALIGIGKSVRADCGACSANTCQAAANKACRCPACELSLSGNDCHAAMQTRRACSHPAVHARRQWGK